MRERRRERLYGHEGKGARVSSDPVHVTVKATADRGLRGQIADGIQQHKLAQLLADEMEYIESPEESDDFAIGDDYIHEDNFDSDLDPPEEATQPLDELDMRLASSLRRVLAQIGIDFPEPSAPGKKGEKEGDKAASEKSPSDADGD